MLSLFQPEKYKVYEGKGTSVGFCSVWNEPERLFLSSEALREHAAITGTLYSRHGVNVILRNLALNPTIRTLFLWGAGRLSNSNYGIMGSTVLTTLWEKGLGNDGCVTETHFMIEKEINREVIEKIRANVELINISDLTFSDAEQRVREKATVPTVAYMEPRSFPEPVTEVPSTFPSERIGWLVRGNSVIETWSKAIERIVRYGTIKGTQYGSQQKELVGLTWVIHGDSPSDPDLSLIADWPDDLRSVTGMIRENLFNYYPVIGSPDLPDGVHYTYGNRIMAYPLGDGGSLDQVQTAMIANLRDHADSRRAIATTMVPAIDAPSKEPPCLVFIQTLQTNGQLNMVAVFRSHDMFKAAVTNAFGLLNLLEHIARETGFERGALQITSQSAHVYEQDWKNAEWLSRCSTWDRTPEMHWDPKNADPRGYVIINILKESLEARFISPDNVPLLTFNGTGKEIMKKIAHLNLLSDHTHSMDIAAELTKADFARELGLPYTQDRPLQF